MVWAHAVMTWVFSPHLDQGCVLQKGTPENEISLCAVVLQAVFKKIESDDGTF
jgi:hypothetical protein